MPQSASATIDRKTGMVLLGDRITFEDTFTHRPALPADTVPTVCAVTAAQAAFMLAANRDWELIGDTMTSSLCTHSTGGGITLTTATNVDDGAIIAPTSVTSPSKSGIATWDWSTSDEISIRARVKTEATAVTSSIICMGFYTTMADAGYVLTTDDDQVGVMLNTDSATSTTNWLGVYSTNSADGSTVVDYEIDSGTAVVASTTYELALHLDSDRKPHFFLDGKQFGQGLAMKADVDLVPYVGIQVTVAGSEDRALTVRKVALGKKDND